MMLGFSAIIAAITAPLYPVSAPLLIALAALSVGGAAACWAARTAVGNGQMWAASPSVLLGWAIVIGGIARAVASTVHGTLLIPLEPLAGIWLLASRDLPRLRFGRPADWRTAALGAVVVAATATNLAPYLPAETPLLSALGTGPDALDASLSVDCPPATAIWASTPVTVAYRWRGIDLGGSPEDQITLEITGPSAGSLAWGNFWNNGNGLEVREGAFSTRLAFKPAPTLPSRTISVTLTPVDGATISAFTVTARLEHAGRWEIAQTRTCGG
jgi:hypothetical protein